MTLRKRLYSTLLLGIYLMLITAHSVQHDTLHHQHAGQEQAHHVHDFHIGIFHFIGHLIHNMQEVHDCDTNHLYCFKHTTSTAKEKPQQDNPFFTLFSMERQPRLLHFFECPVLNKSIPVTSTLDANRPLRAPPVLG